MKTMLLTAIAVMTMATAANAQIFDALKIVKWSSNAKATAAGEYDVTFTATIDKGWHIYSQNVGKGGPIPTAISLAKGATAELVGKAKESSTHKKEGIDENFNMKVTKFAEKVTFTQHIKAKDPKQPLKGAIEFMTCNSERCLPPAEYEFSIKLPETKAATTKKTKKRN